MPKRLKKFSFGWLIWVLVVALGLWWLCCYAGDKLLLPMAVKQIQELTAAKVILKGVDLQLSGAVRINELLIEPPEPQHYDNTIIKAQNVYARFQTASLLTLRPSLKEIIVEDLLLSFQYDADSGRWNVGCLKAGRAGKVPPKWPAIVVKKAAIKCSEVSNGRAEEILELNLKAEFSRADYAEQKYVFDVVTADLSGGQPGRLKGCWLPGESDRLILQGGISSIRLPAFDSLWNLSNLDVDLECDRDNIYVKRLDGRLGRRTRISLSGAVRDWAATSSFEMQAKISDLFHTPEPVEDAFVYTGPLLEKLGPFFKAFFSRYNSAGLVDIELKTNGRFNRLSDAECTGRIICKDVSFCYEKFPYRIEHAAGSIDFTSDSAVLNELRGKHNDVEIAINGYSKGFGKNQDCQIRLTSENMLLDDELYQTLDSGQKKFWRAFSPSGAAQIDYRFVRRPAGGKEYTLAVELLGGQASYQHFPYPLKNLSGKLFIEADTVQFFNVTSHYDNRQVAVNGDVSGLGTDRPRYNVQISTEHIPIDSTLKAALSERQKRFYDLFEADGFIDVRAKVFNSELEADTVDYLAEVALNAKHLSCNKFPLSVADVSARAILNADVLHIEELAGTCDSGSILLSGSLWPRGLEDETIGYCLLLRAEGLEINDDWISFLSKGPAKALSKLKSRGRLNISAELNHNAVEDCHPYRIVVDCLGNSIDFEKFPYPLKDVRGTLTITKDGIYLDNVTALATERAELKDDTGTVKLNGYVKLDGEDFQTGQFSFSADNVFFDQRLDAVLDAVVPNVYEDISPAGRFDLNIEDLKIFKTGDGRDSVDFAGRIMLKDCAFGPGEIISRLDGVLDTKWLYVEGLGLSSADVSLRAEGLEIKGRSLSGVKTNVHYVPRKGIWTARDFVAGCYGGNVTADFELQQLAEGALSYSAQLGFENIELKEFLMHRPATCPSGWGGIGPPGSKPTTAGKHHNHDYTSGRMSGSLSVHGLSEDNSCLAPPRRAGSRQAARTGRLQLSICDMQVGRLSILAKILSVLKLTCLAPPRRAGGRRAAPGDFAFESMFIDSYIRRDELLLEQIDIQGRAFCLRGSGRMNLLSKHIDLHLTASGPRVTSEPSLLASLAEGLAPAVVEVEVTGHFDDPEIKTTTLPVIKHTLGILGSRSAEVDEHPKQD
jgi:hypothetical protein